MGLGVVCRACVRCGVSCVRALWCHACVVMSCVRACGVRCTCLAIPKFAARVKRALTRAQTAGRR